jgi:RHS repeat-associated protein
LGDVVAIFDTSGNMVAKYLYDAWGNCTISSATTNYAVAYANPIRYRGYYYDEDTGLYYCNARYYSPKWRRFISPDDTAYLDPESVNGLNLYCYCYNDPVNCTDPSGHMPEWAKWLIGGLAVAGLVVATVLTFGAAGTAAGVIGAAMLTGGVVSGGINVIDQLHDGGTFDWTELAIATLSGTAYGAVVGLTGGAAGAWSWAAFGGKLAVAGATSLLNSWNEEKNLKGTAISFGSSLLISVVFQGVGYGFGKMTGLLPKNPDKWLTLGDIGSYLWSIPAIKAGCIRFVGGLFGAIWNDF